MNRYIFLVFFCFQASIGLSQISSEVKIDSTYSIISTKPTEPMFPGGIDSLLIFIKENMIVNWDTYKISGKVIAEFTVDKDGKISDIEIIKSLSSYHDSLTIDLIKKMPNWIPAKRDGYNIKSRSKLPLTFEFE